MILLALSLLALQDSSPLLLLDAERLEATRVSLAQEESPLADAAAKLRKDADKALAKGPFSVTHKTVVAPSGDIHDYKSVGPYWWPDPKKEDGLPYIRRDGQSNADGKNETFSDSSRHGSMQKYVETLALAYTLLDEEPYAEHAASLLRTWYLDEATLMNPNLNYGQAIPGRTEGRGIGIIDTRKLPRVMDAATLLLPSEAWTDEDHAGLTKWFDQYLDWLLTSKHGKDEARQHNNHGTYYDVQIAGMALFVGKKDLARETLIASKERRFASQLAPSGAQPHEISRTKSFGYSRMNLEGFLNLARLGEHVGVDLWSDIDDEGRGIRTALIYLAEDRKWPHPDLKEVRRDDLMPLLLRADPHQLDPRLSTWLKPMLERKSDHRSRLESGR